MTSARSMGLQIKHLLARQNKNKINCQYHLSIFTTMKNLFNCVHPCPCGFYGDTQRLCSCTQALITKYQKRISGPLLDRIDIHMEVQRVAYEKLGGD
jgi:predicted ATPase with chaperone activity